MTPGRCLQLHRALAKLGLASRREAVARITAGEVQVNGAPARDPFAWVELGADRVELSGDAAVGRGDVFALHKPWGWVTSRADERGGPAVHALLPSDPRARHLFPVGRLDADSEGLLLFTRDGALGHALTDPAHHVAKRYRVWLDRPAPDEVLARLAAGVALGAAHTRAAEITRERPDVCTVVLREGKNRQIRRMFATARLRVRRLLREAFGPVELGALAPGAGRWLDAEEVARLRAAAARPGLPAPP